MKSFYHEINFDFDQLDIKLVRKFPKIQSDVIHQLVKKIHIKYRNGLSIIMPNLIIEGNKVPLPIGLYVSHAFANYHLKKLDEFIIKKYEPLYYGRYVDDVLIVVKNTVLDEQDLKESISISKPDKLIRLYLKKYFYDLFEVPNSLPIHFRISSLKNLRLNMDKLFIYQFDQKFTPNLIDKFVEDQKERGSMFRFLSDEEDDSFDDFESQTFESNFDDLDVNKARFKNLMSVLPKIT